MGRFRAIARKAPRPRLCSAVVVCLLGAMLAAGCGSSGGAPAVSQDPGCPDGTSAASPGDVCIAKSDPQAAEALKAFREAADQQRVNGALIGIWKDGKPILEAAHGSALPGVPVTRDVHFKTGNVTEGMTSTILLQLVDEGKVELDDPISKWFPDLPHAEDVTLKMISNSTSGYADYAQTPSVLKEFLEDPFVAKWTPEQLVELGASQDLLFPPGTSWSFSDTGYVLLGLALEKITGKPVAELVEERITGKLGLDDTALQSTAGVPAPVLHGYTNARGVYEDSTYWSPSLFPGNGNGTSNLADMGRWAQALGTGELLSAESHDQQIAPDTAGLGPMTDDFYKGLGVIVSNSWIFAGTPHIEGYAGVVTYLPSERMSVVIWSTEGVGVDPAIQASVEILNPVGRALVPGNPPNVTPPKRQAG